MNQFKLMNSKTKLDINQNKVRINFADISSTDKNLTQRMEAVIKITGGKESDFENGSSLQHLGHEGRHSLQLTVPRPQPALGWHPSQRCRLRRRGRNSRAEPSTPPCRPGTHMMDRTIIIALQNYYNQQNGLKSIKY